MLHSAELFWACLNALQDALSLPKEGPTVNVVNHDVALHTLYAKVHWVGQGLYKKLKRLCSYGAPAVMDWA